MELRIGRIASKYLLSYKRGNIDRMIYWMIDENIYKEDVIKNEWDKDFIGWMLKLVANDRLTPCECHFLTRG